MSADGNVFALDADLADDAMHSMVSRDCSRGSASWKIVQGHRRLRLIFSRGRLFSLFHQELSYQANDAFTMAEMRGDDDGRRFLCD